MQIDVDEFESQLREFVEDASCDSYHEDGYLHITVETDYDAFNDLVRADTELGPSADVVANINSGEYYDLAFREN